MPDIFFHHYPQSPVAEKVRVALGIKGLTWRSVEIPRLPPKPDLVPLTGGYRRTPVMQIGADVYCDSQTIVRELENRFPHPSLYSNKTEGICHIFNLWASEKPFKNIVTLALGIPKDLPTEFTSDRIRLYFGPNKTLTNLRGDVSQALLQLKSELALIEQMLSADCNFLLGEQPGFADAAGYFLIWFLRGRYQKGPQFLSQFPNLVAWEDRIKKIGHGCPVTASPEEALQAAQRSTPTSSPNVTQQNPEALSAGMKIMVAPAEDSGDPYVEGTLIGYDSNTISIVRDDPRLGEINIHFPRAGSKIRKKESLK